MPYQSHLIGGDQARTVLQLMLSQRAAHTHTFRTARQEQSKEKRLRNSSGTVEQSYTSFGLVKRAQRKCKCYLEAELYQAALPPDLN